MRHHATYYIFELGWSLTEWMPFRAVLTVNISYGWQCNRLTLLQYLVTSLTAVFYLNIHPIRRYNMISYFTLTDTSPLTLILNDDIISRRALYTTNQNFVNRASVLATQKFCSIIRNIYSLLFIGHIWNKKKLRNKLILQNFLFASNWIKFLQVLGQSYKTFGGLKDALVSCCVWNW
jgi:hypothetical protein